MRKTFWGLVFVALGILALLQSAGPFNFGLAFWPVVWTLIGLAILYESFRRVSWFGLALGLWIGGIGVVDILNGAGVLPFGHSFVVRMGWPVLLIAIGLSVLFGSKRWYRVHLGDMSRWGRFQGRSHVIGDVRYGAGDWSLEDDLHFSHGVGDLKLDLSTATISHGAHEIDLEVGLGEMVVRVPDNVNCYVKAHAGIGELYVFGDHRGGLALSLEKAVTVPEATVTLRIKAEMGVGSLRIIQVPAQQPRLIL